MLFVNCKDGDEAADVFDSCGFARRSDWKIFLGWSQQPTDGPEGGFTLMGYNRNANLGNDNVFVVGLAIVWW